MGKMTIEDLATIRMQPAQGCVAAGGGRVRINVHMGTCGIAAGARDIMTAVMKEVEARDLHDVIIMNSGCAGLCSKNR